MRRYVTADKCQDSLYGQGMRGQVVDTWLGAHDKH